MGDANTRRRLLNYADLDRQEPILLCEVNNFSAESMLEEHIHADSFEFVLFQSGEQDYFAGTERFHVKSGEMSVTFPNELHSTGQTYQQRSHFFYLIFRFMPGTKHFLDFSENEIRFMEKQFFSVKNHVVKIPNVLFAMCSRILDTYFSDDVFRKTLIRTYTAELFCELAHAIESGGQEEKPAAQKDCFAAMAQYIEDHIGERISAEELGKTVYLSASRVHQIFGENGYTLHDYIIRRKMEAAKRLLGETDLKVTEIAFRLGFATSQHFSVVFSKYTGLTPTGYRKAHAEAAEQNRNP